MANVTTINKLSYNMQALQCMLRVIFALALREIHTIYGGTTLGYMWVIVRLTFSVGFMLLFRLFLHYHVSHNMPVLVFLTCGFGIWYIFTDIVMKNMSAIEGNKNLLTFPQVFPLDIMIARCLVVTSTNVITLIILIGAGFCLGANMALNKIHLFILAISLAAAFSLGCGAILSALAAFLPALHNIAPMFFRIMMLLSGVFLPVELFSRYFGDWILYNPVYQFIEMLRSSLTVGYVSSNFHIPYLLCVCLAVLTTGLLLERYIRKRLQK